MTPPTKTYLDSGVLIAASHGNEAANAKAMTYLDDPQRVFIASDFVRIETEPIARYHHQTAEADFYAEYLRSVLAYVPTTPDLMARGIEYVAQFGVLGIDALHLAAAEIGGAEEFITTEGPPRPFFRVSAAPFRIVSIKPPKAQP